MTDDQVIAEEDNLEDQTDTTADDLNAKIKNIEEVAKKAQHDYVMLKYDFDSYQRRVESDNKEQKTQILIDLMKKLLPLIDQLSYSVANIPAELEGNKWADGVKLVYDNAVKTLASLGIEKIATIGQEPDSELHEPLSAEPTEDETLKGKIIKEYQPGYILKQ